MEILISFAFKKLLCMIFFTPVVDKWILGEITRGIGCLL
jgi:hypothetical protein